MTNFFLLQSNYNNLNSYLIEIMSFMVEEFKTIEVHW